MITKIFKGLSDCFGTFAYMEDNELVIGENVLEHSNYLYRGSLEAFRNSRDYLKLAARNRPLLDDINDYYNFNYKYIKNKNQEDSMKKLCEIKVDRADSLKELCYHLTASGYTVQTAVIWKEFPNTGIDCWQIAIFDKEIKDETVDR
jgi:hypothetical protein